MEPAALVTGFKSVPMEPSALVTGLVESIAVEPVAPAIDSAEQCLVPDKRPPRKRKGKPVDVEHVAPAVVPPPGRADFHTALPCKRASQEMTFEAGATNEGKMRMLAAFDRDVSAASSRAGSAVPMAREALSARVPAQRPPSPYPTLTRRLYQPCPPPPRHCGRLVPWVLVLLVQAVAATSCTGSSTQLPADQCSAWMAFFDSAGGSRWENYGAGCSRTDPCYYKCGYAEFPTCGSANTAIETM